MAFDIVTEINMVSTIPTVTFKLSFYRAEYEVIWRGKTAVTFSVAYLTDESCV